ncbi:hypothetical protein [Leptospira sp. GIMC2001]|uniref:hypothetical protein n=1 Tax=Leptospira sp. GIMC2001 TaxID=1513297 RepID=UPI00300E149C
MTLHLGILLQDSQVAMQWLVFVIALIGLIGVIIHQFIIPFAKLKALDLPDAVNVGDSFDFVVDETSRQSKFTIGKRLGNIRTLCKAIDDDHLIFNFKKDRDQEEYEITVDRNGAVLFKPPRMDTYSKMEGKEKFDSVEIIGHSADFRLSDKLTKERMVNFIEISLSTSYFFNKNGEERMKFTFTITRIQPGLNRNKRNRDGSMDWGAEAGDEEESDDGSNDNDD